MPSGKKILEGWEKMIRNYAPQKLTPEEKLLFEQAKTVEHLNELRWKATEEEIIGSPLLLLKFPFFFVKIFVPNNSFFFTVN